MNIYRRVVLFVIGIPLIKEAVSGSVLSYLQQHLSVDLIQSITLGESEMKLLSRIAEKLKEERYLHDRKKLLLCSQLQSTGLMTQVAINVVQKRLKRNSELRASTSELQFIDVSTGSLPKMYLVMVRNKGRNLLKESYEANDYPVLPWLIDPNFFDKHPEHIYRV